MRRKEFFRQTPAMLALMFEHMEQMTRRRYDTPAAVVGSVVANVNRDEKKRPDPYTTVDIMPWLAKDEAKQSSRLVLTPEEVRREANVLAAKGMMVFSNLPSIHRTRKSR